MQAPFSFKIEAVAPFEGFLLLYDTGGPWLPVAWQAQYTGRPGRAAARVAASGAAAAFCVAGAVRRAAWTSCCCGLPPLGPRRGCLSCGRRSAESLLDELSIPDYFFIKTSPCLHSTSVLKYPPCVPLNHCHQYTSLLKVPPRVPLYHCLHSTSLFKLPFYVFI